MELERSTQFEMAEYLFFDTLSNQLRKTIRFYDPFSEYKSPTHYQVLKWIFCWKVLWKNLCFHIKNENSTNPTNHTEDFRKKSSHTGNLVCYLAQDMLDQSSNSGRGEKFKISLLFWVRICLVVSVQICNVLCVYLPSKNVPYWDGVRFSEFGFQAPMYLVVQVLVTCRSMSNPWLNCCYL